MYTAFSPPFDYKTYAAKSFEAAADFVVGKIRAKIMVDPKWVKLAMLGGDDDKGKVDACILRLWTEDEEIDDLMQMTAEGGDVPAIYAVYVRRAMAAIRAEAFEDASFVPVRSVVVTWDEAGKATYDYGDGHVVTDEAKTAAEKKRKAAEAKADRKALARAAAAQGRSFPAIPYVSMSAMNDLFGGGLCACSLCLASQGEATETIPTDVTEEKMPDLEPVDPAGAPVDPAAAAAAAPMGEADGDQAIYGGDKPDAAAA